MTPPASPIHHEVSGDLAAGTPVLLLRPIVGTIALWGAFRSELALRRPVIACEARGIGRSPPAVVPTTTRGMARDAAALLDTLQVSRAHVFGLSLGGMVATWLAIDRPERVHALVLASTPPRGLDLVRFTPRSVSFARCTARGSGEREACLARHALSDRFCRDHPHETASILASVRGERGSLRSLLLHSAAGALHHPGESLRRIDAPTLCIAGALDPLARPGSWSALSSAIRDSELEVLDEAGHDLSLERPVELAERVERFLARHDPR
ncbi:MAG: alpha/beta fold hydrolase [Deltaproteobacteria bacterium]|nr:alpha/beta fold hydrolase [Deltaproteobacteria bacterium]